MIVLIAFAIFYILAIISTGESQKNQRILLLIACVILAYLAGVRDPERWADTDAYILDFEDNVPLFEYSFNRPPFAYTERGFHLLGSIVKLFSNDYVTYLLFVSAITFIFLYKDLNKYCIFPAIGLCDYIARFLLNRNFIQIRSALAIAIIFWAIQYVYSKEWKKYYLWILIAYFFHHSALIAVPFYFFNMVKFKKKHIYWGLILAFIVAMTLTPAISSFVEDWSTDLQYTTYTSQEYQSEIGLRNPMIYLQLFIMLYFTYYEEKFSKLSEHYYLLRNAYFYSTLILVVFCQYTALSGRTSTMFATVEVAMIPLMATSFNKRNRMFFYVISGVLMVFFFYLKRGGGF